MNLIQTKLQHNNNFIKTKFSLATPNKLLIIHDIFYILYKNNMLFDFNAFIGELRENSEKKEIIEKYENALWTIAWWLKEQIRYRDYLSTFTPRKYLVPDELQNDFDRDLLEQLVLWSFSSDYEFKANDWQETPELYIAVKSWDQSIVKKVSELWSFQIQRLYEIYVEEQINLEILRQWSEDEKNAIEQERIMRQKRWQAIIDTLWMAEEAQAQKAEQAKSLDELMWKL